MARHWRRQVLTVLSGGRQRQGLYFLTYQELVMSKIISAVRTFIADEEGVTALEYGMIAALIAVAIVAAVTTLGGKVSTVFTSVSDKLPAAAP
jgi:pilus assembly protein Flp/PilA